MTLSPLVQLLVDASVDATAVVTRDLEVVYFNSSYARLSGLRPRELTKQTRTTKGLCHELFGLDTCQERCVSHRVFESGRVCRMDEVRSTLRELRVIVTAIPLVDGAGQVWATIEQYRDVTAESRMQENYRRLLERERLQNEVLQAEVDRRTAELARANEHLRETLEDVSRLALTDSLTGLFNRRYFDRYLREQIELARSQAGSVVLLLLDLDHFKRVNDLHGHPEGDRTLQEFARILRTVLRENDMAARVGGEEFALILPGVTTSGGLAIAKRLQQVAQDAGLLTTTSGGLAAFSSDISSSAGLLRAADRALYAAKVAGRNRICVAGDFADALAPAGQVTPVDDDWNDRAAAGTKH